MNNSNEWIFKSIALKKNKEFNYEQFKTHNGLLLKIIMLSMQEAINRREDMRERQYVAIRDYAMSLEKKLGINLEEKK